MIGKALALSTFGLIGTTACAETLLGAGPFPVFNQAYQENYEPDALADLLGQAKGAYVLLDPFAEDFGADVPASVAALNANGNEVGAYISVGTGEDWRADFAALKPYLVTSPWDQWAGEYFVSSTDGALPIMAARIDKIAAWGFDWVEFDNMDWAYDNDLRARHGFAASIDEGVEYVQTLCAKVHAKGMRCMAKNMTEGAETFDGALFESYSDERSWWDQEGALGFIAAGKPVIIVHYDEMDCAGVYSSYRKIYGDTLSFICEDSKLKKYVRVAN